jgi:hypothetical protein
VFHRQPTRRLFASIVTIVVGILAVAGQPAAAKTSPQSDPEAVASVVGGQPASIADFPWLAFIKASDPLGSYACTGTVVAPRLVLTAGHCVEDLELRASPQASDFRVLTGATDRREATPTAVSQVVVYPGFNTMTVQGDAGLLILSTPVSAPALPLASSSDSGLLEAGTPISIAGWGLTEHSHGGDPPNVLRWGSTVTQPTRYCERRTQFLATFSPATQFCTVDTPSLAVSACFGDSGGPAIAKRADGSAVEVGITSQGGENCARALPNVFTRVDGISAWVSSWIASVEAGGPPPGPARGHPPRLPVSLAESVSFQLLERVFDKQRSPADHEGRFDCTPIAQPRVRCKVAWIHRHTDYFGKTMTFYALEHGTVVMHANFMIHWSPLSCRLHRAKRQGCAVHTRRG